MQEEDARGEARTYALIGRLGVTLGVMAAVAVLTQVPVTAIVGAGPNSVPELLRERRSLEIHLLALGVMPYAEGALLVEFAALFVPAWQKLRVSGPSGRAKLFWASLVVTIAIAVLMGMARAQLLQLLGAIDGGAHGATVLVLCAGAFLLVALALIVDRFGVGSGFAVLLVLYLLKRLYDYAIQLPTSGGENLLQIALAFGIALAALGYTSSRARDSTVPAMAPGIVPMILASAMVLSLRLTHGADVTSVPLAVVLSLAAAWVFARPRRIRRLWRQTLGLRAPRLVKIRRDWWRAVIPALLLLGAASVHDEFVNATPLTAIGALTLAAWLLDLRDEFKARGGNDDLVAVWELHRVYAEPVARRVLERARIPCWTTNVRFRSLYHFFGPFFPIRVLVRSSDAARARRRLDASFTGNRDIEGMAEVFE